MLACAPQHEEQDLSSKQHIEFLKPTLEVHNQTLKNIIRLAGDNCSVNQKDTTLKNISLIGCYSHTFNLAVDNWISSQYNLEEAFQVLRTRMSQVRTIKNSLKLRN